METKKPVRRSQAWFGKNDRDGFVHRSWIKNQGYPHDELDGRQVIGAGTGVWKMSEMVRAGEMTQEDFTAAESCMHRSKGNCMTVGTASTMASMVEALGMSLPENAAIPAADTRRNRLAQLTGRRIVEMVKEDLTMSKILTRQAFENAIRTNAAIGGSTNAVIHLLAIAGRIGVDLKL